MTNYKIKDLEELAIAIHHTMEFIQAIDRTDEILDILVKGADKIIEDIENDTNYKKSLMKGFLYHFMTETKYISAIKVLEKYRGTIPLASSLADKVYKYLPDLKPKSKD